ncbi:hypothetical protein BH23PLA1_BH23PLA1_19650 [soil metagenome]
MSISLWSDRSGTKRSLQAGQHASSTTHRPGDALDLGGSVAAGLGPRRDFAGPGSVRSLCPPGQRAKPRRPGLRATAHLGRTSFFGRSQPDTWQASDSPLPGSGLPGRPRDAPNSLELLLAANDRALGGDNGLNLVERSGPGPPISARTPGSTDSPRSEHFPPSSIPPLLPRHRFRHLIGPASTSNVVRSCAERPPFLQGG